MSSDVTVLGLGAMGAAIANAFLNKGYATTVWNRSESRFDAFRNSSAQCVRVLDAAVSASPVVVVCIDDYDATFALFERHNIWSAFENRTLIQFSTGTPGEARKSETLALKRGARYLDGAILAYPREIGNDGIVAVSGDEATYAMMKDLLDALSTDIRYLGAAIGGAAGLDLASLSFTLCTHLGLLHAALICEAEDVSREKLAEVVVDSQPSDALEIMHLGRALQANRFENPGASIDVYNGVLERILSQADAAGIDARIPEFAAKLYKQGSEAGFGNEEVVALIKLLRKSETQ